MEVSSYDTYYLRVGFHTLSVHSVAFWKKTFPCLSPRKMFKPDVQGGTSDSEKEPISGLGVKPRAPVRPVSYSPPAARYCLREGESPSLRLSVPFLCLPVPFPPRANPLPRGRAAGPSAALGDPSCGRGHAWLGGRDPRSPPRSSPPRTMFGFEGLVDKVDVEVMIAIGGALLISSFFLMCCFLCVYCKLASTLKKL